MARVEEGIQQRGAAYRIDFKYKGKRVTETHPGPCDSKHLRQVIERRDWLKARLKVGLPIYEDDVQRLQEVFCDWIATLDVKRSTLRSNENLWKNYWAVFNDLTAQSVSTPMIKRRLAEKPVSNKTKKNALGVLSAVMRHAEANPNPCNPIKIKKAQTERLDLYTPEQITALLSKLRDEPKVYFTLLAATGLRPGEALGLLWSDWDGEYLDVSKQIVRRQLTRSTKTNVRRRVFVPTWARETISGHSTRFKGGYVFQNTLGNHHCDTDVFNKAWRKAHERAQVPYKIPYTLRHNRASELLSTGCDYALAAKQLGHSVEMFLRTYAQLIEEYTNRDYSPLEGSRRQIAARGDVSA